MLDWKFTVLLVVCGLLIWAHGIVLGFAIEHTRSSSSWNKFVAELKGITEKEKSDGSG